MRKNHDPDVRAAVMGALLAGQGVAEVARDYRIPLSTVSRWRQLARAEVGRSDDVGALLLTYLREALATLTAQQLAFRDAAWLREQEAGQLAVLHGVTVDKCVRLLESLQGGPLNG